MSAADLKEYPTLVEIVIRRAYLHSLSLPWDVNSFYCASLCVAAVRELINVAMSLLLKTIKINVKRWLRQKADDDEREKDRKSERTKMNWKEPENGKSAEWTWAWWCAKTKSLNFRVIVDLGWAV